MKIARIIDRTIDILVKGALLCGGLLLLAMAINVTYGVVTRYAFHAPSVYAIDLTKILMIPALVFSVAYVQKHNRHLQVDFLVARFNAKFRLIVLEIIVPLAGLFVGAVLVWKGWESMAYSFSIHETSYSTWAEPLWPVRLTIPIGYGLLSLVMIGQILGAFARLFGIAKTEPTASAETTVESERV